MKSDLYEQGNDDMYNRMLEKLKDQKPSKSGMKMMDMNEEVERFIMNSSFKMLLLF